ncbi:IPT/TIG domain-containing protein [Legionella hackeliae]|uniref:IPT/TIG domain-containing protein n=1 Tax=Legionella hackeliae TaxID=449 RepID=A0A0A8UNZ4_LEGHA|nr:IPT/TIG domain-containing protein [Legionella hackeliae]KTD12917.1 protein with a bacterial immunoglobulin-like domain protein [Legionella hackeliae]CEK09226.1 exported protein of unknown function [Legionella hackeliae]STX49133.1 protein with a bacterial immunoglobulin-like domain [Legionella hackeliae]
MQRSKRTIVYRALLVLLVLLIVFPTQAGIPLWTFKPLTPTAVNVPSNSTAIIQYRITNRSSRLHVLRMRSIRGITQITAGPGICRGVFILRGKDSCILSLRVHGNQLTRPIVGGPIVCQQNSGSLCYQPKMEYILRITQKPPVTRATISVSGSPLTLTANGTTGQLTIRNESMDVAATNITSNFTGTALDDIVTETANTCANVLPGRNCTITYAGITAVSQTNFTIKGSNTNTVTAAIAIASGSTLTGINPSTGPTAGGTGVILTGTGLTGATGVSFGGVAATSVYVASSTMVTAVTPAHTMGLVDVTIDTPAGGATLTNGFTYITNSIGQLSGGGKIACLNGGQLDLIVADTDISSSIQWGGNGATGAQDDANGALNTNAIVSFLGNNGGVPYAAQLCDNYEIDSQNNTPCLPENTCYSDWFLPARDQLNCIYINSGSLGTFGNFYWTSTESSGNPTFQAWGQSFFNGAQGAYNKGGFGNARCARNFIP